MKLRAFTLILALTLIAMFTCFALAGTAIEMDGDKGASGAGLICNLKVPLDKNRAADTFVAGDSWGRARVLIENKGSSPLESLSVSITVPDSLNVRTPTLEGITATGQLVEAEIGTLNPGDSAEFFFDVKPPASVEYRKNEVFTLRARYAGGEQEYKHKISLVPPPSWLTYLTILASLLLFIGVLAGIKRLGVLELFTTVDLITIALLAAVIAVVFRYISKLVNLGWFDGLVVGIPTVVLMIVALQLVRKPGTATLLFTCVLLISMVVWGSHIMWLGFYLAEGVVVDLLVFLSKMNYADSRLNAIFYGISRCAVSTLIFYLLYAPVEWKISYAPWYIGLQLAISCAGGLIGGSLGYDTAVKMSGARL